jgi:hypothetical protein
MSSYDGVLHLQLVNAFVNVGPHFAAPLSYSPSMCQGIYRRKAAETGSRDNIYVYTCLNVGAVQ